MAGRRSQSHRAAGRRARAEDARPGDQKPCRWTRRAGDLQARGARAVVALATGSICERGQGTQGSRTGVNVSGRYPKSPPRFWVSTEVGDRLEDLDVEAMPQFARSVLSDSWCLGTTVMIGNGRFTPARTVPGREPAPEPKSCAATSTRHSATLHVDARHRLGTGPRAMDHDIERRVRDMQHLQDALHRQQRTTDDLGRRVDDMESDLIDLQHELQRLRRPQSDATPGRERGVERGAC